MDNEYGHHIQSNNIESITTPYFKTNNVYPDQVFLKSHKLSVEIIVFVLTTRSQTVLQPFNIIIFQKCCCLQSISKYSSNQEALGFEKL